MKKFLLGMALAAACFGAGNLADAYTSPTPFPHKVYNDTYRNTPTSGYYGPSRSNYVSRSMTLHLSYRDADGFYEGEVNSRGLPDGQGRFTTNYQNDNVHRWCYEGQFRDGHFEGQGRFSDLDQSRAWHEGVFTNDELTGYGKLGQGGRVIWEGYFHRDMPLETERSLPYPVRYYDWDFYISDIYEDSYLGNVRANGKFIILKTSARNITNQYARSIASSGLVRLWDRRNGTVYRLAADAMRRYYNDYGSARWMTDRMAPATAVENVVLVFDVPSYVDNSDLTLIFYGGGTTTAHPYSIHIQ